MSEPNLRDHVSRAATGPLTPQRVATAMGPLVAVAAQLAVLAFVIRALHIESAAFYDWVVPIAFGGWALHHVLPLRWRRSAFVLLSLAAIVAVFRRDAAWIVGIGLGLIALARAPVSAWLRLALVVVAGLVLAALRAAWIPGPVPPAIWPVLGSMFMFRLLAYLYDAAHAKVKPGWTDALAYFFCLPNVAFPLFPVIDFATFRRTYYDRPAPVIYQQGIAWMVRGVTHLVLYRLVYQYATISPSDVATATDLVRYILANFALYLRVSGQFHLIVGMLHLFGFRLPETHRFFYLASSFTDFWRRINIYWKEFMQKVVFNPTYFPLRRRFGDTGALVLATLAVFCATWFFHSYQWFWLLGTWLWSVTDTLFWGILAVLLVVNVLRETRHGRARSLGAPEFTLRAALGVALRTAGTFTVLALLWTLWTSPTLTDFVALMTVDVDATGVLLALGVLGGIGMAAVLTVSWATSTSAAPTPRLDWKPAAMLASLLVVWVAGEPAIAGRLSLTTRGVLRDVRLAELNRQDAARLQRGYYENIVGVNRFNGQLWEVYSQRAREMPSLRTLGILFDTNDERQSALTPLAGAVFHGASLRTNSWGMRDREYTELPPPGTYRIALLGQSYVMGMGVGDGQVFESLIEDRLNGDRERLGGTRFEILNFAAPRYSLAQQWYALSRGSVLSSRPRAVLVVGHVVDLERMVGYLEGELRRGAGIAFAPLRELADSMGIVRGMPYDEMLRRLKPHLPALVERVLGMIADEVRMRGAVPIYAFIPMPLDQPEAAVVDGLLASARRTGYTTIDLRDVFTGRDAREIIVAEWDRHPNPEGHRIIADTLYGPLLDALGVTAGAEEGRVAQ